MNYSNFVQDITKKKQYDNNNTMTKSNITANYVITNVRKKFQNT